MGRYVVKRFSRRTEIWGKRRIASGRGREGTAAWQMRCEARGLRDAELAAAKAEVEKPKLPKVVVARAAVVRGETRREMTTLRRGIVAPRCNTYVLISLVGLLLQTQSATGESSMRSVTCRLRTFVRFAGGELEVKKFEDRR